MKSSYLGCRVLATAFGLALLIVSPTAAVGQVAGGTEVSVANQRALGLVTVNGGCSGTLLNQFWVLTARHCVTVGNQLTAALQPANQVQVTATWTANVGTGTRIHDFAYNSAPGSKSDRDIVLVYLGNTNLGVAGTQKIFSVYRDGKISGRLKETDTVTQYGIGFSTFAEDLRTPSDGAGIYRSAQFTASNVSATHYDFVNKAKQSGHGHDSGGASVVTVYGQAAGIAGVQSGCKATGYVSGAPTDWLWATGISHCWYVSTEPFLSEISAAIKEVPPKTPYITTSQVIILSPYHPFAVTILQWDGGPAHPSVEIYVSVNQGPDIPAFSVDQPSGAPVFKQPKGAIEMKLPRRSGAYRYTLKAGGVTLAGTNPIYVQ